MNGIETGFLAQHPLYSSLQEMRVNPHLVLQMGGKWEVTTVTRGAPCATPELLWLTPPLSKVVTVEARSKWS